MDHKKYMALALELAREAFLDGEAPVGCVIVGTSDEVIGRGRNTRERDRNALGHAELNAIYDACRSKGGWRLDNCSMYVTLEPCPMCAGAVINSRISKLFYGARDTAMGSCGSVINLFMERYGHSPQIVGGIMEDECSELLTSFFKGLR